jgi:uncharacterized protein (TIGR03437 family)
MFAARSKPRFSSLAFVALLLLFSSLSGSSAHAQQRTARDLRPDVPRALAARNNTDAHRPQARKGGYTPRTDKQTRPLRPRSTVPIYGGRRRMRPARIVAIDKKVEGAHPSAAARQFLPRVSAGTPLSRVLHTSQLSNLSSAGTHEQLVDQSGDLEADERTTFDTLGGSFDIALGRSGSRYEVYTATDDRGTATTSDDRSIGVLVLALDSNGDYQRDTSSTFDLERDFQLPSAVSVVSGTSKNGREFVVVSSSGYYDFDNPADPSNEPSAGVVLLVRDPSTGGFDPARSRSLIRVGSNELNNANALALLPNNDLLVADFTSNELRIVRDTNADGLPDQLDPEPFYSYRFSDDAPLDIAANSRGVVFSHSFGNDAVMLAVYDDNNDGRGDADEVVVEGLSLDNNLILHGLTVDREGTVYVIEDASGAADTTSDGGNGGEPRIDAFPDPALNGILRDGSIFFFADDAATQSLTGLSFGVELVLAPVRNLSLTNAASLRAPATRDGLAAVLGAGLTRGRSGATQSEASKQNVFVTVEGVVVPVLSFGDSQINVYVPKGVALGANSVVVYVDGEVIAADDQQILLDNPGLFTYTQTGTGEAVALLASEMRYTASPFPAMSGNSPSVISLFGTGWRNALPVTVLVGGRTATVEYAGAAGGFPGLDQINVRLPEGTTGAAHVYVTTANNATSRADVFVNVK